MTDHGTTNDPRPQGLTTEPADTGPADISPAERFRSADQRYTVLVARWNGLPTAEARAAANLADTMDAADLERQTAAAALLHEAAGRHRIEQQPGVPLTLGSDGRWEIDRAYVDDVPLYGDDNGPFNGACEHDTPRLDAECQLVTSAAGGVELPTFSELTALMLEYLCEGDEPTPMRLPLTGLSDQAVDTLSATMDAERQRRTGPPADPPKPTPAQTAPSHDVPPDLPGGSR
ncbi:hypothetical protein [Actinoplanes sp. M2I2]|uniref:hypothetical protein n=1 Tax=Actinoplanes sp. M2I2 TaxID=1734444 RepID=UPI0020220D9B|nr:hypothetical protein [Actinoplanes sp. M2I2]